MEIRAKLTLLRSPVTMGTLGYLLYSTILEKNIDKFGDCLLIHCKIFLPNIFTDVLKDNGALAVLVKVFHSKCIQ